MSSDSSEDENLDLLREAVDNDFLNNDLFDPKKRKDVNQQPKKVTKPSLRHRYEEEENCLNVTAEVQNFVGKKLLKFLDSQIKEVEVPLRKKRESEIGIEAGIRLFGASPSFVSCEESTEVVRSHSKKRKKAEVSDDEYISEEERCREAAAPVEWILSQEAVAGWVPSTKGKLEIYSADEVIICNKRNSQTENAQMETPEEKADRKKLKRKRRRERLRLKTQSCNKNGISENG